MAKSRAEYMAAYRAKKKAQAKPKAKTTPKAHQTTPTSINIASRTPTNPAPAEPPPPPPQAPPIQATDVPDPRDERIAELEDEVKHLKRQLANVSTARVPVAPPARQSIDDRLDATRRERERYSQWVSPMYSKKK